MDEPRRQTGTRPLPLYVGPYERWIFSASLGRPFAFPAIADGTPCFYTALAEGGLRPGQLDVAPPAVLRLPPLWNPGGGSLAAIPFALDCGGGAHPDFAEGGHGHGHGAGADGGDGPALFWRPGTEADRSTAIPDRERGRMQPRYRANYPVAARSWVADYDPACALDGWTAPATAPAVIVAIIDDGIPFAHRAFLDPQGRSRVSHCWLQSAAAEPGPSAVPFGRELTNAGIDALRAGFPNEAQLYREAGAMDAALPDLGLHLRGRASHGAHIAGLCAGNDPRLPGPAIGGEVQIIAVQLPNTVAWDTSGFGKEMFMLSAFHYILSRARAIAARFPDAPEELPLIVNFSYGWSANRHDGGAAMERAFQQLLTRRQAIQPDTALVMPMGNNFDGRMHAQITPEELEAGAHTLGWWLSPDDMTSSYLEIWFPAGFDPRRCRVSVAPPPGYRLDRPAEVELRPGHADGGDPRGFVEIAIGGQIIAQLSADKHFGERWRVLLALIPTIYSRGQPRRAPAGEWRIRVEAPNLQAEGAIDFWLQRDDDPEMLRSGGRQSHLVDPAPAVTGGDGAGRCHPRLSTVRGYGTFNGISSAPATIRVAGYVQSSGQPSRFSGAGGLRQGGGRLVSWGVGPTLAAPADQGRFRPGLPSIGVLSGSGARLQGTSASAALVTRWMVRNLVCGRAMTAGLAPLPPLPEGHESCPVCAVKRAARLGQGLVPDAEDWD